MSNYVRQRDFSVKDTLPSGSALKKIMGSDVDAELDAIVTAVGTKLDDISGGTTGRVPLIGSSGTTLTDSGYSLTDIRSYFINVTAKGATGDGVTDDTSALQVAIDAGENTGVIWPGGTYLVSETLLFKPDTTHIAVGDVVIKADTGGTWTAVKCWNRAHDTSITATLDSQTLYAFLDFTGAFRNRFFGKFSVDCSDEDGLCAVAISCNPAFSHAWQTGFEFIDISNAYVGFLGQNNDSAWTGSWVGNMKTANCKYDIWVQGNSIDDMFISTYRAGDVDSARCNGGTVLTLSRYPPDAPGSTYSNAPCDGLTFGAFFLRTSMTGDTGAGYKKGIVIDTQGAFKATQLFIEGEYASYPIELEDMASYLVPHTRVAYNVTCTADGDGHKPLFYIGSTAEHCRIETNIDRRIQTILDEADLTHVLKIATGTTYHDIDIFGNAEDSTVTPVPVVVTGAVESAYSNIAYRQAGREYRVYYDGSSQTTAVVQKCGYVSYEVTNLDVSVYGYMLYPEKETLIGWRITNTGGTDETFKINAPSLGDIGKHITLILAATTNALDIVQGYAGGFATHSYVRTATGANRSVTAGVGMITLTCVTTDGTTAYWYETWSTGLT